MDTAASARMIPAAEMIRGYARIVVIAPHPDDDVLGCGGLLAAAAGAGCEISVVYVTDGSASHVGSSTFPPARLRDVRECEARASLKDLGVTRQPIFLRMPDGELARIAPATRAELIPRLTAIIAAETQPTLVLAPWRRDPHPDHRAAAELVRDACADAAHIVTVLEYCVWLDERGAEADRPRNGEGSIVTVDVEPFVLRKQRALAQHRSQLGGLIRDAAIDFALPPSLVARAGSDREYFVRAD